MSRIQALFLSALLPLFGACGGGGGSTPSAANQGAFAGTWDVTLTVTASTCPQDPVGSTTTAQVVITVTGATASIPDPGGAAPFTGTISGNNVRLTRAGSQEFIQLAIANDQLSGTANTTDDNGGTPCAITQSIAATRSAGVPVVGSFAGDWDFFLTVLASNCPSPTVGETGTERITITVVGTTATIADTLGDYTGTIQGNTVTLTRPGDSLQINIQGDTLSGTGTFTEDNNGTPCQYTLSFTATRVPGGTGGTGGALALATGPWVFSAIINGAPVTPFQGTLAQNGANVTFTLTAPFSQTWTGPLSGSNWTPVITGAVPIDISGAFGANGQSFNGTINSPALGGSGTITGTRQ